MPGAGMESLHNIGYNIHSHNSIMDPSNGYVRLAYHSKPDYYQKPTEEGPIDFSLKPNAEIRVRSPEISNELHTNDSETYRSEKTVANHLQDKNFGKLSGSMLEQHLRNGTGFTNGNQRMSSPAFGTAKFDGKNYEQTVSPSHFNTQSIHKMYYEAGEHRKASEDTLNRSQATSSQFIKPFSEDNAEHHLNAGHSPESEYGSVSALHHAGVHYAYARNAVDKKSEATANGSFSVHEFSEKRSSHSPETIKREEYYRENVTNLKDFNFNKRLSASGTCNENRDTVAIDDVVKVRRNEFSGSQSNLKNSSTQSRYGRKEGGNAEPETHTRFQGLSANASPFVPNVYNNMGIMGPTVSPNFPHLNPLAYPPAMLSSFNPFLSANPLAHPLNPMSTVSFERKNDKNDRPFKQFANELIYGMQTLLPVKPPMVDKNYVSVTEPTSSTLSPHSEKQKNCSKGRSPSTERSSPPPAPQNSNLTPSDESVNSASPRYHENDNKLSQSEQKEDSDSNNGKEDEKGPNDSNSSFSDTMANNQQPPDTSCGNGKRRSLPEHMKNDLYWAKRRKNNAAAKRSRDARRKKEDLLAVTAKNLRDHNYQLQIIMAAMQEQINFQTTENKRLSDKCNTQEIQIFRLKEDQERNQKLCRRCSARILDVDSPGNGL